MRTIPSPHCQPTSEPACLCTHPVSQHQRAALERPLSSDGILMHSRSQAHCAGALAGGVDCAVGHLLNVLEELRCKGREEGGVGWGRG